MFLREFKMNFINILYISFFILIERELLSLRDVFLIFFNFIFLFNY